MKVETVKRFKNVGIVVTLFAILLFFAGCNAQKTESQSVGETAPSIEFREITGLAASEENGSVNIRILGNGSLVYSSVKQNQPLAVILYFPETIISESVKQNIVLDSEAVNSVSAVSDDVANSTRVEILLGSDTKYDVQRSGDDLIVSFESGSSEMASISEMPVAQNPILPVNIAAAPVVEETTESSSYSSFATVNRIDFSSESAGKSTVILGTTRPVEYSVKRVNDKLLKLILRSTNIPDYRKRQLITTRFNSAVDRIIPFEDTLMPNSAIFSIELRESVPYSVEQVDNFILMHFEASTIPPRPLEAANLPDWQKVIISGVSAVETIDAEAETADTDALSDYGSPKVFKGEKIALDFYETDLKNVFRILMEVSGENFAVDKDVKGTVTLTFDKPVPWDQVLDLVLRMNHLSMVREGDIIRIATLATMKKEEDLLRAKLESEKKKNEEKKALEPLITDYIHINYSNAQSDILPHLNNLLSDRGKISVDARTNQIIMTDIASVIAQSKELVMQLDRVTPQVVIEARIVEANTNFSRELGTAWGLGIGEQRTSTIPSGLVGNPNSGMGTTDANDAALDAKVGARDNGTYGYNMGVNTPVSNAVGAIGFNFLKINGTPMLLNAKLLAMESQGQGRIVSSPKIVTLDNKVATIKQGLRYPFFQLDESGNTTLEWEDIDLSLEVTPHVTLDDRISMLINIVKADLGTIINGNQSFTNKEAVTELLVDDGDTIVIGGIIKTSKSDGETGVPLLKDIPILGWLFKYDSKVNSKEELLIFITPNIVKLAQTGM
ncbi:MAG: type IV pilus secretin PilQ [Desulfobacterales bacterium]|nr:type IV pilus secretin PilQ [Desulfobacterales bacterium]